MSFDAWLSVASWTAQKNLILLKKQTKRRKPSHLQQKSTHTHKYNTFCNALIKYIHGLSASVSVYQRGADSRSSFRKERLLEEDVQISECRQWYKQPIRAGHVWVHHCPLWYHHRPAFTITIPTDLTAQEAQIAHRYVFVREKFFTNIYHVI